jgi:PAS domain S-box-containing protein
VLRASEGIFESTVTGKFETVNPAMVGLLGYSSEKELLEDPESGINRFANNQEREGYFAKLYKTSTNKTHEFEYKLKKKDGTEIWVKESVQMELDPNGQRRIVGFVEDINERKEHAKEREAALKEKEEIVTMLSHQLRSPVWQAYERANFLVRDLDPNGLLAKGLALPPVPRLATIRGLTRKTRGVAWSIDMMSKLVQDGQDGQIDITEKVAIPARNLLKTAREAAQDEQLLRKVSESFLKRVGRDRTHTFPDIITKIDDNFASSLRILGKSDLIEQCVGNLIENAFKYSKPSSTIQIELILQYDSATLNIINEPLPGLEIDETIRKKCRIKDWRSDGAQSSDADGVGLGLWFTDRIMQAHQGELIIEVTDDSGLNKFSLFFPLSAGTTTR